MNKNRKEICTFHDLVNVIIGSACVLASWMITHVLPIVLIILCNYDIVKT